MILRAKCCRRINFKSHKVMLLFIQPSTTLHFWFAFSLWSVMWVLLEVIVFCIYAYLGILPALYFYCWDFSISEEKAMAPHSSTLAWKIPWTKEPGGLQSMGLRRVGHDWATSLSLSCIGEGNGNPLQCSCLENPRDGGAWWLPSMGSLRVGHDWNNLAVAAVP